MAKQEVTYDSIIKEVNSRQFAPIYYLMGEETYYIDRLSDYIAENVLTEEERGFNQMVIYGQDTDIGTIVAAAKRYPMMAEFQVIIVKEAQTLRNMDELIYYLQKPQPTTVLVFCHKHGTLDRRKKVAVEIEKTGRLFESKKLKDSMLPSFISNYVRSKGTAIDVKAANMMVESIGSDLSRLASELDKLIIAKPQGDSPITPELVEDCVGISKDYNVFELKNALMVKDVVKANTIAKYMEDNLWLGYGDISDARKKLFGKIENDVQLTPASQVSLFYIIGDTYHELSYSNFLVCIQYILFSIIFLYYTYNNQNVKYYFYLQFLSIMYN